MKCPNCGKEIADTSKFCEFCGEEIKFRKINVWYVVIAVLLVAVICLLVVNLVNKQQDSDNGNATKTIYQEPPKSDTTSISPIESDTTSALPLQPDTPSLKPDPVPAPLSQSEYVDLGLPSGTCWKTINEPGGSYSDGLYTFDEAKRKFGSQLPTYNQIDELCNYCQWYWTGGGYRVMGPNGQSIMLPLTGYRTENGLLEHTNSTGNYMSRNMKTTSLVWKLYFEQGEYKPNARSYGNERYAVRLVRLDSQIGPASKNQEQESEQIELDTVAE